MLLLGPVLVPALIRVVGRLARRLAGAPGRLATDNAVRNPRRTATTTASLLVGVTLTTAVLTGMASARAAIGSEMDLQHPLDGVVTATSEALPAGLVDDVRSTPGVAEAVAVPGALAKVEGIGRIPVLEGGDPAGLGRGESSTLSARPGVIRLHWGDLADGQSAGDKVEVTVGDHTELLRIVTGEGWGRAGLVAPATLAALTDSPTTQAVWVRADRRRRRGGPRR